MHRIYRLKKILLNILRSPFLFLGFANYLVPYVHGDKKRLKIEGRPGLNNAIFNTRSGSILIGNRVLFGHNCMVLTGKHNFLDAVNGDLRKIGEVPTEGNDIEIGEATWIASGSIILGGVKIGKHCIIMAGSVVTKNIDDYSVVAGIPAKLVRKLK